MLCAVVLVAIAGSSPAGGNGRAGLPPAAPAPAAGRGRRVGGGGGEGDHRVVRVRRNVIGLGLAREGAPNGRRASAHLACGSVRAGVMLITVAGAGQAWPYWQWVPRIRKLVSVRASSASAECIAVRKPAQTGEPWGDGAMRSAPARAELQKQ